MTPSKSCSRALLVGIFLLSLGLQPGHVLHDSQQGVLASTLTEKWVMIIRRYHNTIPTTI